MGNLRPIFDSESTELHEEKGVVAWGFLTNCVGKARKPILIPRFHESLTTHANIPVYRGRISPHNETLRQTGGDMPRG